MARAIVVDGLRLVPRTLRHMRVPAKGRWFGKTVVETISKDFPAYDMDYCVDAVKRGMLGVLHNDEPVSNPLEYLLSDKSIILHSRHQHEPPVLNLPSPILFEDETCLVVSKAPSMPVHPTANYFRNTVSSMLQEARPDLAAVHPVHRLDRLTSGALLFAKNGKFAGPLFHAFRTHSTHKMYLARVSGRFGGPNAVEGYQTECTVPIARWFEEALAHYGVSESGKAAHSKFRLLSYRESDNTSLLEAIPISGRTHQLRIHLAHLGHPVIGDPLYGKAEVKDMRTPEVRAVIACMDMDPHCPLCKGPSYESRYASAVQASIALHALKIDVHMPDGKSVSVTAPPPSWAQ